MKPTIEGLKQKMEVLAFTIDKTNLAIAKVKGIPLYKSVTPLNECRSYTVEDWAATCSGCSLSGRCSENKWQCGKSRWFPIPHFVTMSFKDGVLISSTCSDGKRPGPPCKKKDCDHIGRAIDAVDGREAKGVSLHSISKPPVHVPKCPNCRERWSVSLVNNLYECRNPTCQREGKPWQFEEGSTERPKPIRKEWVIRDKEPGRVQVKREQCKKWGQK